MGFWDDFMFGDRFRDWVRNHDGDPPGDPDGNRGTRRRQTRRRNTRRRNTRRRNTRGRDRF